MLAEPDSKTSADRWRNTTTADLSNEGPGNGWRQASDGRFTPSNIQRASQACLRHRPPIGRFGLNVGASQQSGAGPAAALVAGSES